MTVACECKGLLAGLAILLLSSKLLGSDSGGAAMDNSDDTEASPAYRAGYELGVELERLRQQDPDMELDDALSGMAAALAETCQQINTGELCATLQAVEDRAYSEGVAIPARQRGFKDDFAALNARREGVVTLPSGVQYEVLKASSGARPGEEDAVVLSYEASLSDGTVFDSTYEDEQPLRLEMDEIVAPGLKEALLLMNEGAQWRVVIPPSMGFGRAGNNQLRRRDLIYTIELISVERPERGDS